MLLSAGAMDEMELSFYPVHGTGRQQHRWTISEAVNSQVLLMMGENFPETSRADWVQIIRPKSCILLVINYELY